MRINQFVASSAGLSRRAVDKAIIANRIKINSDLAKLGQQVSFNDKVFLDGKLLKLPEKTTILLLNKPVGYVCSRDGQGSPTIYDLIPAEYQSLKPVGRLDKETSGLLIITDDGTLAYNLTHPKFSKLKTYLVAIDRPIKPAHQAKINSGEVELDGRPSLMKIERAGSDQSFKVSLSEGRNRQIRRTFEALGYRVVKLHRSAIGDYHIADLGGQLWIKL